MESIEFLPRFTIAAWEHVIFVTAWCTISPMKITIEMIHLPRNVGTCRVWVSLGWFNPGNFLIPPSTNLDGLHRIHGNGIHKHHVIDSYRLHRCHDYRQNTWKSWLGIVFCADNEACHCAKEGFILPQISSFPCNPLLTRLIWILPLVNIYISGRFQSFKHLI